MKWLLFLMVTLTISAMAADVSGNWKATAEGPNGPLERTFVFKVDGDNLSFTITAKFQDMEIKLTYKGKVGAGGNEITLTSEGIGGAALEWHAKRV